VSRLFFVLGLFVFLFILSACNTVEPIQNKAIDDETEFVFSTDGLGTTLLTPTTTRNPRLVVRLNILKALDSLGNPNGKRYGQATFVWTDKSAAKGGSDLNGSARVVLREAGQTVSSFEGQYGSITSNLELIRQAGYQGHIIKSSTTTSLKPLCIELRDVFIEFQPTNFSLQPLLSRLTPITFCQANNLETNVDMSFTSSMNLGVDVPAGERAVIKSHIMNSGVRPAQNVYATFKVNNLMTFVGDKSELFECSSRAIAETRYTEEVTCYAPRFPVGVQSVPLIFERTNAPSFMLPITGSVRATLSTTSLERDYTNNTAGFSAIFQE
jgi:hypothetical protein